MLDPEFHLGLIGYPLGHTLSPLLQTAAFASVGLTGTYRVFAIPPEQFEGELDGLLANLRDGKLHGLNVTLPYKRRVIGALDSLTAASASAGAVNTIWRDGTQLAGDNTDIRGFLNDLESTWSLESDGRALILGAGGAALSVAVGLLNLHWRVTLVGRNIAGLQLSSRLFEAAITASRLELMDWDTFHSERQTPEANLVINATPLGMFPEVSQSPWPASLLYPQNSRIYDLVYNPTITRFLADAQEQGLETRSGIGMLVEQAALAFEIWTGRSPDRTLMMQALDPRSH